MILKLFIGHGLNFQVRITSRHLTGSDIWLMLPIQPHSGPTTPAPTAQLHVPPHWSVSHAQVALSSSPGPLGYEYCHPQWKTLSTSIIHTILHRHCNQPFWWGHTLNFHYVSLWIEKSISYCPPPLLAFNINQQSLLNITKMSVKEATLSQHN